MIFNEGPARPKSNCRNRRALVLEAREGSLLGKLPNWAINLLVERRAACRELALLVMLGSHQRRAVAEGPADALAVEPAVLQQLASEIGLGQSRAADADEGDASIAHVRGASFEQVFLQVAIAAADHGQVGKGTLNLL